jgi:predicted nucleotidyltransferase
MSSDWRESVSESVRPHVAWAQEAARAALADALVALYLYGSHAQSEADLASDVDLCAVTTVTGP